MQNLLIAGLVGATIFTFANLYNVSTPQSADENPVEAQAKIALVQAILEEENEDRQDPENLLEDEDPEDGDEVQGDVEDDDQEDPSDEGTILT
jgi:hypothetical protein